jgi:secreted trypsin-like serine protease
MICAADFFMDACQGDSGGPLFAKSHVFGGPWNLLGITSFGVGCAQERYPGVYTLASNYRSWVDSVQAQFPPDPWD